MSVNCLKIFNFCFSVVMNILQLLLSALHAEIFQDFFAKLHFFI